MASSLTDQLAARLGVTFRRPHLIDQALVHASYANENPGLPGGHNERLEFLGDAVLGLLVSGLLYARHPDEDEGLLTARRASLVNRDALAGVAVELGLQPLLRLGRGEAEAGGRDRPSVLAAAFEALAGALYLSDGLETSAAALGPLFESRLRSAEVPGTASKPAKSRLQEWSQRERGSKPSYQVLATSGPPHDQVFEVAVSIEGQRRATGRGTSRHRAEEAAAAAALDELGLADQ